MRKKIGRDNVALSKAGQRVPLPVFDGVECKGQLVIHCPYCREDHAHELTGGRVAAGCTDETSPYQPRGYIVLRPEWRKREEVIS